jgi:hypothetical protein
MFTHMQEALVRFSVLSVLEGRSCRAALAIYRTANGWIAYFPRESNAPDASIVSWGLMLPTIKSIAARIPSLEAAPQFIADPTEQVAVPAKAKACALGPAAAAAPLALKAEPTAVMSWPQPAPKPGDAPTVATPKRLRIDVGWRLWSEGAEGTEIQYQVCGWIAPLPPRPHAACCGRW